MFLSGSQARDKEIVFIWVPSHLGNTGNSTADSAAKDAVDGNITDELIPLSDLKTHVNKYIFELWQSECDKFLHNKHHKIFSKLNYCITCPQTNRKEETVISRLHIGHLYITCSFLLKGEEPPVCILCDEQPLNIFYLL